MVDKRRATVFCILFMILIAAAIIAVIRRIRVKTYSYDTVDAVFRNPMMGFAPNADYFDAVGDNTLVYMDVTWRELEPEEGVFDFAGIEEENFLDTWRTAGKKVVFRFVCDEPSDEEHIDIPDWLYEKTGDGTFYDTAYGRGYSPDYSDRTFIEYHAKAVKALGERYGEDSFFCFIELGSVGHWGEWHVKYDDGIKRLPSGELLRKYVEPYLTAFPNAKLLMRRPFPYVSEYGMGVYNDMTGHSEDTQRWLSWISEGGTYSGPKTPMELIAVPEVWKSAPVGGEFTSAYPMSELLTDRLDETLSLLADSHMTFIGPMCPIANKDEKAYPGEVHEVLGSLGYRYGVSRCRIIDNRFTGSMVVKLTVNNHGTAQMYFDWPLCVYLIGSDGSVVSRYETDIRLTDIYAGESAQCRLTLTDDDRRRLVEMPAESKNAGKSEVALAVGIENPDTGLPEVKLDMEVESRGNYFFLN